MKKSIKIVKTDVLIIGGGAAALRAAMEAAKSSVSVILATKGKVGKSGATAYRVSEMAGFNVPDGVKDPEDNPDEYYHDMMDAAEGMADEKLVQIIADRAQIVKEELKEWGVPFKQENEKDYAFLSCFSQKARTHVIPGHGEPIILALIRQMPTRVKIMEDTAILQILVKNGICVGAYGIRGQEEIILLSKAVILATGGAGQLFEKNMNPRDVIGDGYAMGYLSGAALINMEFMQAGIGISYPKTFLLNAYLWGAYPNITNNCSESIFDGILPSGITTKMVLEKHQHHFPFSSDDCSKYFEIAVQKAVIQGRGSDHHGVFCDMTMMTDAYIEKCSNQFGLHEMWPVVKAFFLSRGMDVRKQPVEIACFAHAINGGLQINERAETTIAGLYAAGEVAGGPHGANRLGGNMMLTCLIFGEIAGACASEYAKRIPLHIEESRILPLIAKTRQILYRSLPVADIRKDIQQWNQKKLLILRNEDGLQSLKMHLEDTQNEIEHAGSQNYGNVESVELYHMVITSKLMAQSAWNRKESRGSHYRDDIQGKNEIYGRALVLKNGKSD